MPAHLKQHADRLQNQGRLEEAIDCYRASIREKPDYAEAIHNLGLAFKKQNRLHQAVACFRKALKLNPNYAIACNNLANVLQALEQLDAAKDFYRKALEINPEFAETYNNLGNVLRKQGCIDDAIQNYQRALALKPNYAEACNNLANACQDMNDYSKAIQYYRQAIKIKPDHAGAYNNLANALQKKGDLQQALDCYQQALLINPDYAEAHNNAGNALVDCGKISEAAQRYRRALGIDPAYAVAHSNLLLSMQYDHRLEPSDFRQQYQHWWTQHGACVQRSRQDQNSDDDGRALRIGYVSGDFRRHSVGFFILPLLQAHDREKVEVYCYSTVRSADDVTEKIRKLSAAWRSISGVADDRVAAKIRADGIDILVDLAGHTADNRLLVFARRPAPVQITWLGYPDTTGMPVIDYRLTDEIADPPGEADQYHSEALIRMPEGFLCYGPPEDAPDVSGLPAHRTGRITFGSFNNLPKINAKVVALWSRLLQRVPNSVLLLKSKQFADEQVRQRYLGLFAGNGIAAERIRLLPRAVSTAGHLAVYHQVDIGLDPLPYNGTTTSCEALWMGVPVVTLRGSRHAGRVGASILTRIGLAELIAETEAQYEQIGTELAEDLERLEQLRTQLRDRMQGSPLCDSRRFARTMENSFRMLWKKHCDAQLDAN